MWVEAILLKGDLDRLVAQLAPMTIEVGAGRLTLEEPAPSTLVPDVGLRVTCKARLRWPVLGLDVPVSIHSISVICRPEVVNKEGAQVLAFKLEIEHVNVAGVPKLIDDRVTKMANEGLANHPDLAWKFTRALTHSFRLPRSIEPLDSLELTVLAARVKITAEAMALAVEFDSGVTRRTSTAAEAAHVGE